MKTYLAFALGLVLTSLLTSCSTTTTETSVPLAPSSEEKKVEVEKVLVNDYPTRDRVEYVFNCIAKHGGLSYINQYACGCKIDKIAEKMRFQEYDEARTFTQLYSTPGEKGAVFRDPKQSKDLRTRLKEAEQEAEKACFVNPNTEKASDKKATQVKPKVGKNTKATIKTKDKRSKK